MAPELCRIVRGVSVTGGRNHKDETVLLIPVDLGMVVEGIVEGFEAPFLGLLIDVSGDGFCISSLGGKEDGEVIGLRDGVLVASHGQGKREGGLRECGGGKKKERMKWDVTIEIKKKIKNVESTCL